MEITRQAFNDLPLEEILIRLNAENDLIATRDSLMQYAIEQIQEKDTMSAAKVLAVINSSEAVYFRWDKLTPEPITSKYDIYDMVEITHELEYEVDVQLIDRLAEYERAYSISNEDRLTIDLERDTVLKSDVTYREVDAKLKGYQQRENTENLYDAHKPFSTVLCVRSENPNFAPNTYYALHEFDKMLKIYNEQAISQGQSYNVNFLVLPAKNENRPIYEGRYTVGSSNAKGLAHHIVSEAHLLETIVTDATVIGRLTAEDADYFYKRCNAAVALATCIELDVQTQGIYAAVDQLSQEVTELRRNSEPIVFFDNKHSAEYEAEVRKIILSKYIEEGMHISSGEITNEAVKAYIRADDKGDWNRMRRYLTTLLENGIIMRTVMG